ncbi:MAG: hypothetical protein LLG37_01590 [Spirochaetia bacterium]|nr:hypothetical protein [Spirochaetia bacterium]
MMFSGANGYKRARRYNFQSTAVAIKVVTTRSAYTVFVAAPPAVARGFFHCRDHEGRAYNDSFYNTSNRNPLS